MSKADECQRVYRNIIKTSVEPEVVMWNLRELIEDMIMTIRELEEMSYPGGLTENLPVAKVTISKELETVLTEAGIIIPH